MTFQSDPVPFMNLNLMSNNNTMYVTQCTQDLNGATAPCSASPTNVIETLDETALSGIGATFTGKEQGGFVLDGREVVGSFVLEEKDSTGLATFANTIFGVGEIT